MPNDFYAVLGVPRNATNAQIRNRFLELVRERHPDRVEAEAKSEAEARFQEITEAFNVLGDPDARLRYDRELTAAQGPGRDGEPSDAAKAYLQRGVKAYRESRYLDAADWFNRAVKEEPESARGWFYLARTCQTEERWWGRAVRAAIKACELEPMNAEFLTLAGTLLIDVGDPGRALGYLEDALAWGGDESFLRMEIERARKAGGRGRRDKR